MIFPNGPGRLAATAALLSARLDLNPISISVSGFRNISKFFGLANLIPETFTAGFKDQLRQGVAIDLVNYFSSGLPECFRNVDSR